jgi:hypothetical protein
LLLTHRPQPASYPPSLAASPGQITPQQRKGFLFGDGRRLDRLQVQAVTL